MTTYSQSQIRTALSKAGFPPEALDTMAAIVMAESGGRSEATAATDREYSVGPFQINLKAHGNQISEQDARDLDKSAQYAARLYQDQGFNPWSAYTAGTYRQFLPGGNEMQEPTAFAGGDPSQPTNLVTSAPAAPAGNKDVEQILDPITKKVVGYRTFTALPSGKRIPDETHWLPTNNDAVDWAQIDVARANADTARQNARSSRLTSLVSALDQMIQIQGMPAAEALKRFNAEVQRMTLEQNQGIAQGRFALDTSDQNIRRANAMNEDARVREISEANRKVDLQTQATRRAESLARDILPSAVPGATSMTLPMLGTMPLTQVNPDQFYSQGLPPLLDQWNQPISQTAPNPWPGPTVAPALPPLGQLPPIPQTSPVDIDQIMKEILPFIGF